MPLQLPHPQSTVDTIVAFIAQTFQRQHKPAAVIAVSGGIDSALSLTLTSKAVGEDLVMPVLLPYGDQDMTDAWEVVRGNGFAEEQVRVIDIQPMVDLIAQTLQLESSDYIRLGNLKARMRMICVYDLAKKNDALVVGTENKSEHYLGYFTRFGDAASDLEPISHLYKTQVKQLAEFLQLPESVLTKAPSAGLWAGQSDEEEMGFTYEQADLVLEQLIDQGVPPEKIKVSGVADETIAKVVTQVERMAFKRVVPYTIES